MGRLQCTFVRASVLILVGYGVAFAAGVGGATPHSLAQHEEAVRFQLLHDVRLTVENHFKTLHAKNADAVQIGVEPDLITVGGEPWLAAVQVVVRIPEGKVDPDRLRNLLLASYSSQGFDVSGRAMGGAPKADIVVKHMDRVEHRGSGLASSRTSSLQGTRASLIMVFLASLVIVCAGVVLLRRRSKRANKSVSPVTSSKKPASSAINFDRSWDLDSLLDAPSSDVRKLFKSLPIEEAIHILARLDAQTRHKILDELHIRMTVRKRIEDRLLRIYAKG